MNVKHGAEVVGFLVEWLELPVGQSRAVHVAEQHCAWKAKISHGTSELDDRCSRIAQRQRGESREAWRALTDDFRESVVHQLR